MLSSKKRNKFDRQFLVLALGFVCCAVILSACSAEETIDVTDHYGETIATIEVTDLFVKENADFVKIGSVEANTLLALDKADVQSMNVPYFKLKDDDIYIDAYKVSNAAPLSSEHLYYLPFPESITTKENHTLYDEKGNAVFHLMKPGTYTIYIKDEETYGVMVKNHMYFIKAEDMQITQPFDDEVEEEAQEIAVLMYHAFYDENEPPSSLNGNYVEKNEFEEQLKYLKDNGYITLTMKDVDLFLDQKIRLPKKSIALTSDDGYENVYTIAYPLLQEYDFHATVFLIGEWFPDGMLDYWKEAQKDGTLEFQSHSMSMHNGGCNEQHGGRLLCTSYEEGVDDTRKSLEYVKDGFVYCYPFGDFNDQAKQILKDSGVRMAYTTQYGKIKPGMDKYELPRIRIFGGAGMDRFVKGIEE